MENVTEILKASLHQEITLLVADEIQNIEALVG